MNIVTNESNVACFHQTGQCHIREGIDCEDVSVIVEKGAYRFYGLADGQSGKRYCKLGGEAVLNAVSLYLEKKGVHSIWQNEYEDEIQYELVKVVRDTISQLSKEYGSSPEEFASTMVVIAIDTAEKLYATIHLGDGGIIGIGGKDQKPCLLSAPENGISLRYTWLTTSSSAMTHIRLHTGSLEDLSRIIMITDGATMFLRGKSIVKQSEEFLCCQKSSREFAQMIQDSAPQDDASCLIIDLCEKMEEMSPDLLIS